MTSLLISSNTNGICIALCSLQSMNLQILCNKVAITIYWINAEIKAQRVHVFAH